MFFKFNLGSHCSSGSEKSHGRSECRMKFESEPTCGMKSVGYVGPLNLDNLVWTCPTQPHLDSRQRVKCCLISACVYHLIQIPHPCGLGGLGFRTNRVNGGLRDWSKCRCRYRYSIVDIVVIAMVYIAHFKIWCMHYCITCHVFTCF